MKNFSNKLVSICFILLTFSSVTYAQFSLTGEVRPRTEYRNGFKKLTSEDVDAALFVEQRSRLYFGYNTESVKLKITLQDVRIWGNASQIYKVDPALSNVYEAYGEFALSKKVSVKAGRQELNYDNARFLGNLGWAAQGRSHDALLLIYKDTTGLQFHAGAAFNQNVPFEPGKLSGTFYNGVGNYKTMQYAWLHKDFEKSGFSFLLFNDGRQAADSTVNFRQTYGFFGHKMLNKVRLEGELYYQGGKNAGGKDVSALLAAANITFKTSVTPLTIGVDYMSGTAADADKDQSFAPLYGTNHKFYGFMDYFYVGNGHQNKGLLDYSIKTKFKTGKKSALIAHLHHFQSPVSIVSAETGNELTSTLGQEIDLVYNLNVSKEVNFKLGYSQLFATESMEAIKGGDKSQINNWAWAMLTIKPTLFKD